MNKQELLLQLLLVALQTLLIACRRETTTEREKVYHEGKKPEKGKG